MPFTGTILMHWSDKYMGLPYHKYNCAQLVKLVYKKELNKELVFNFEVAPKLVGMSQQIEDYFKIYVEEDKLKRPEEFSIALMHGTYMSSHIGVTTKINGRWYVLHAVLNQRQTVRNRIRDLNSTGLSIEGFYKCRI